VSAPVAPPVAPTPAELQRATTHGVFWTVIHTMVAIPVAFAANAVVARALGAGSYGDLATISLVLSLATVLSNFAVSESVIQWGAAAHARGDAVAVDDLLRKSLGYHLVVQLPVMTAVVLLVLRGAPLLVQGAMVLAIVAAAALGSTLLCVAIENLTARAARLAMVTNLLVQSSVAATAAVSPTPASVWTSRSVAACIVLPFNARLLSPRRRRAASRPLLPRSMPAGFWRYCRFTVAAGAVSTLVSNRSEIFALQWLGTPNEVGIYALAFGVASQLRGPIDALLAPLAPSIAGIVEAHPTLVRTALLRSLRVNAVLAGLLMVVVPAIAGALPWIYGESFSELPVLFVPMAAVAVGQSVVNPLVAVGQARRQGRELLLGNVAALLVDTVVAVAAIQVCGVWGAVAATICAQSVTIWLLVRFQVRGDGPLSLRDALGAVVPFVSAVVLAGLVTWAMAVTRPAGPWLLILGTAGIVAVWVVTVRASGAPVRDDLWACLRSLPSVAQRPGRILLFPLLAPRLWHRGPAVPASIEKDSR